MPDTLTYVAETAQQASSEQHPGAELPVTDAELEQRRQRLLAMRVSRILEAHPDALDVLIGGGFEPLANPVARLAMAHTVNLSQALRIRGQSEEQQEALIDQLLALGVDGAGG